MLFIPVWWERRNLFRDIHDAIAQSKVAHRIDVYLFASDVRGGQRWLVLFSFAALTAFIVFTTLNQFDALLKGMHPSGGAAVGMNGLASVFEFDLSQKPLQIIERVGGWAEYAVLVGPGFATGYAVATGYLLLDSLVMIPAYAVCIGILLLHVRRTPPMKLDDESLGSYDLVNGVGFLALAALVISDLVENLMTWVVIDSAWSTPGTLADWTVRLMWFASLFRTLAVFLLIAVAVLSIAFRAQRYRWLGDALVSVRGQILVVLFIAAGLGMAQMEDVVRRWTVIRGVPHCCHGNGACCGRPVDLGGRARPDPSRTVTRRRPVRSLNHRRVRLPWRASTTPLRRVVVLGIFGDRSSPRCARGRARPPVGLGFVVPAATHRRAVDVRDPPSGCPVRAR